MTDIGHTIVPRSDQTNFDDLIAGPRTITVTNVEVKKKGSDQPVTIHYEGDEGKPYKPGLSMRRVLFQIWGPDSQDYIGKSMTIFGDPTVKWAGKEVGGIRISHMSHIDRPRLLMLTTTRGQKAEYRVEPLKVGEVHPVLAKARDAADQGGAAFKEFWGSAERKKHDDILLPEKDDLIARAQKADEAGQTLSQQIKGQETAGETPESDPPVAIDPEHPEFQAGHMAFSEGVTDCPHEPGTDRDHWLAGNEDARKEAG